MADLFQGAPLPDTTTTQETQKTAPQFYTDYLQNVANMGQNAVQQGGVAGLGGLTQQAMNLAPTTGFAGSGTTGQAADLINQAGHATSVDNISNYMNPYQSNVIDEMSRLTNRNIQESILPALEAAGVSTGNYGGLQQQNMISRTLRDIQADLLGKQYGALNTGYQNAMTTSGNDLTRGINAGQALDTTAQTQNAIAQAGLNQMNTLGKQQQAQTQAQLNNPMDVAQQYAKLFGNPQIPTGEVQTKTGPGTQGQYGMSPMQQVTSLAALINAAQGNNYSNMTNIVTPPKVASGGSITQHPEGATHVDDNGNYYDMYGNLVI